MTAATKIQTNYLVYTADPWQTRGSYRIRGITDRPSLAEKLKRTLIANEVDEPDHIHILPVALNECETDGAFLL